MYTYVKKCKLSFSLKYYANIAVHMHRQKKVKASPHTRSNFKKKRKQTTDMTGLEAVSKESKSL